MDDMMNKIKIIVVGNSCTGKTSLLERYVNNTFTTKESTIGGAYKKKRIVHNGIDIVLNLWDTAGQEKYRSIVRIYYRGTMGCLLVFDITNRQSFDDAKKWITEIRNHTGESTGVVLVGNKADLDEMRKVSVEEATKYAESENIIYYETSAKTNDGVNGVFEYIVSSIYNRIEQGAMTPHIRPTIKCDTGYWNLWGYCW